MTYAVETLSLIVKPLEEKIYSELATVATLTDEGGGLFVEVTQPGAGDGSIRIEPAEWPAVKSAIDALMNRIQWHTKEDAEVPDEWFCSDHKHSGDPEPKERGDGSADNPHF